MNSLNNKNYLIYRKNKKIEKNCVVCNKQFFVYLSEIKRRIKGGNFCSRTCMGIEKTRITNSLEYFWSNVDIKTNIKLCWEWKKYKNKDKYGKCRYNKKNQISSRVAYFLSHPEQDTEENQKLYVLHTCDNPPCCNPSHLFLGTQKDNIDDKINKNRQLKGEYIKSAKLTEEQVREILLLKNILKIKTVAEMYKVDYNTIHKIINNKTWKHVEKNN